VTSAHWALRAIGVCNRVLHDAALKIARKLATSEQAPPRWIAKHATRQLAKPAALKRIQRSPPRARDVGTGLTVRCMSYARPSTPRAKYC
jgi:hypothetical protein